MAEQGNHGVIGNLHIGDDDAPSRGTEQRGVQGVVFVGKAHC